MGFMLCVGYIDDNSVGLLNLDNIIAFLTTNKHFRGLLGEPRNTRVQSLEYYQ